MKVGIGKNLVVVDISQNALRGAVRFFPALSSSSSSSSSSSTTRKKTSSSSPLSNVRYLNVSGNRHLTAIVDLHEFKNLEYFDASRDENREEREERRDDIAEESRAGEVRRVWVDRKL